jgi:hypothetical protein
LIASREAKREIGGESDESVGLKDQVCLYIRPSVEIPFPTANFARGSTFTSKYYARPYSFRRSIRRPFSQREDIFVIHENEAFSFQAAHRDGQSLHRNLDHELIRETV